MMDETEDEVFLQQLKQLSLNDMDTKSDSDTFTSRNLPSFALPVIQQSLPGVSFVSPSPVNYGSMPPVNLFSSASAFPLLPSVASINNGSRLPYLPAVPAIPLTMSSTTGLFPSSMFQPPAQQLPPISFGSFPQQPQLQSQPVAPPQTSKLNIPFPPLSVGSSLPAISLFGTSKQSSNLPPLPPPVTSLPKPALAIPPQLPQLQPPQLQPQQLQQAISLFGNLGTNGPVPPIPQIMQSYVMPPVSLFGTSAFSQSTFPSPAFSYPIQQPMMMTQPPANTALPPINLLVNPVQQQQQATPGQLAFAALGGKQQQQSQPQLNAHDKWMVMMNQLGIQPNELTKNKIPTQPTKYGFNLMAGIKLRPDQEETIDWALDVETKPLFGVVGHILSLEMGLGKTLLSLCLCALDKLKCKKTPRLVMLPLSLVDTWRNETEKFFGNWLKVYVFHDTVTPKADMDNLSLEELLSYDIVILTYDSAVILARKNCELGISKKKTEKYTALEPLTEDTYRTRGRIRGGKLLLLIQWSRVIADESHLKLADIKGTTFQASKCFHGSPRTCLSGTVMRNYESDFLGQLMFIGYNGCPNTRLWCEAIFERQRLIERVRVIDYEDAKIVLPICHEHKEWLELSPQERAIYEEIKGDSVKAVNDLENKHGNFASVLAMITRLRQCCIASFLMNPLSNVLDDPTDCEWLPPEVYGPQGFQSTKFRRLRDIVHNIVLPQGSKAIVFCAWTKSLNLARRSLTGGDAKNRLGSQKTYCDQIDGDTPAKLRGTRFKNACNDPDCRLLFLTFGVGACGVNLQAFTHVIFLSYWSVFVLFLFCSRVKLLRILVICVVLRTVRYFSLHAVYCCLLSYDSRWNSSVVKQALRRSHRVGQENEVHVWFLLIKGSIEERVVQITQEKDQTSTRWLGRGGNEDGDDDVMFKGTAGKKQGLEAIKQLLGAK